MLATQIFLFGSFSGGCVQAEPQQESQQENNSAVETKSEVATNNSEVVANSSEVSAQVEKVLPVVEPPPMVQKPIPQTPYRERLTREYAMLHYGTSETTIVPQAVVVHWTAGNTWQSAYNTFLPETRGDGTVNVCSHYIVGKDGTIFCLTEETALNRHAIGYNWCSIGIENVGGVGGREDLTQEQLQANIALIKYLHAKYPTIKFVFGHYQQVAARASGLYIERVQGYRSIKPDPGKIFMRGLQNALEGDGLTFFPL